MRLHHQVVKVVIIDLLCVLDKCMKTIGVCLCSLFEYVSLIISKRRDIHDIVSKASRNILV